MECSIELSHMVLEKKRLFLFIQLEPRRLEMITSLLVVPIIPLIGVLEEPLQPASDTE